MAYFPVFCQLEQKKVVLFGGGKAAWMKAKRLLPYGACVQVYASHFCKPLQQLALDAPRLWLHSCHLLSSPKISASRPDGQAEAEEIEAAAIEIVEKEEPKKEKTGKAEAKKGEADQEKEEKVENGKAEKEEKGSPEPVLFMEDIQILIQNSFLVISALGDPTLDEALQTLCQKAGILFNAVDQPDWCDFIFSSTILQNDLSIGISTSGASPIAARYLCQKIEEQLPKGISEILAWMKSLRPVMKASFPASWRKEILETLLHQALKKHGPLDPQETEEILKSAQRAARQKAIEKNSSFLDHLENVAHHLDPPLERMGKVYVAGAGCGSLDWLTIKAGRLLQSCDVLVYDDLISQDIVDAFRGEEKVYVGKRKDRHSLPQEEINQLLIQLAQKGKSVLRLKGGDPFVFGRGMEEVLALRKAKIDYELVPGISSAQAIPLRKEIPVTHRNMASGFMVVSASRARNNPAAWQKDVQSMADFGGTIVVLMGFSLLEEISRQLIEAGKDPHTQAAVLSSPDIAHTDMVQGELQEIALKARQASLQTPAILMVGEVVGFAKDRRLMEEDAGQTGTNEKRAETVEEETIVNDKIPAIRRNEDTTSSHSFPDRFRVGFVGTKHFANRISRQLPVHMELIECMTAHCIPSNEGKAFLKSLEDGWPDWLVFTSWQASQLFLDLFPQISSDFLPWPKTTRLAGIGKATMEPFIQRGIQPNLLASRSTTEDLAHTLAKELEETQKREVLEQTEKQEETDQQKENKAIKQSLPSMALFRSQQGSPLLERCLESKAKVQRYNLYTMDYQPISSLDPQSLDVLVFGSSQAIRSWFAAFSSRPEERMHPSRKADGDKHVVKQGMKEDGTEYVVLSPVSAAALPKEKADRCHIAKDISARGIADVLASLSLVHQTGIEEKLSDKQPDKQKEEGEPEDSNPDSFE